MVTTFAELVQRSQRVRELIPLGDCHFCQTRPATVRAYSIPLCPGCYDAIEQLKEIIRCEPNRTEITIEITRLEV